MTLSNFTLRRHEDIDHRKFYSLKNVRHMCRSNCNHFPYINVISCGIVIDVSMTETNVWVAVLASKYQGSLLLYYP